MRVDGLFLVGLGIFFAIIGIVYWVFSYEDGGFLMLMGSALLGILPGSYYLWWARHMKPQPDDDPDASVARGRAPSTRSPVRASGRSSWVRAPSSPRSPSSSVSGWPDRRGPDPLGRHRGDRREPQGRRSLILTAPHRRRRH